jgi:hypothetical protein
MPLRRRPALGALSLAAEVSDTYNPFSQLAAVTADLKFCGGYLRQIARGEQEMGLEPEEVAVCRWAGAFAPRVLLLAAEVLMIAPMEPIEDRHIGATS